ncbi:PhoH family protein [Gammaproteobacteria bacterium]|nr:PhoH family protein [Gammaproteobacteria bacterium]
MASQSLSQRLVLEPENPQRLANLCGRLNEHLKQIEKRLLVKIQNRGNEFMVIGAPDAVKNSARIIHKLYDMTQDTQDLAPDTIHITIQEGINNAGQASIQKDVEKSMEESMEKNMNKPPVAEEHGAIEESEENNAANNDYLLLRTPKASIKPRGLNQNNYVRAITRHDINFGIGPAGTGKTYLAVACAVEALIKEEVSRILLVRPAVEAGEKLGFLPGDLSQKVDPYLRPLYDALYEMLGFERVGRLIEKNVIEVAPLAYMRGRTLNNAFIILDESQNTTTSQMKMFLTRIGFGSTAVITGDVTQIDLPKGVGSGLVQASKILENVEGVSFTYYLSRDVVRHPIVQKVVEAYDDYDKQSITELKSESNANNSAKNKMENDRLNERDH